MEWKGEDDMSLVNCRALTGSRDLQAHHYVKDHKGEQVLPIKSPIRQRDVIVWCFSHTRIWLTRARADG